MGLTSTKVIFLDIDGVLWSSRTLVASGCVPYDPDDRGFDADAIGMIRAFCRFTGSQIVLSSSWRIIHDFRDIGRALRLPIVDKTKRLDTERGEEIAEWLSRHPNVDGYAILDDDDDMREDQLPRFVHVDRDEGFSWKDFQKLSEIFGVEPMDCVVIHQ